MAMSSHDIFPEQFGELNHYAAPCFWNEYENLEKSQRRVADRTFDRLARGGSANKISVYENRIAVCKVGRSMRAIGYIDDKSITWGWIGTREGYEGFLARKISQVPKAWLEHHANRALTSNRSA